MLSIRIGVPSRPAKEASWSSYSKFHRPLGAFRKAGGRRETSWPRQRIISRPRMRRISSSRRRNVLLTCVVGHAAVLTPIPLLSSDKAYRSVWQAKPGVAASRSTLHPQRHSQPQLPDPRRSPSRPTPPTRVNRDDLARAAGTSTGHLQTTRTTSPHPQHQHSAASSTPSHPLLNVTPTELWDQLGEIIDLQDGRNPTTAPWQRRPRQHGRASRTPMRFAPPANCS